MVDNLQFYGPGDDGAPAPVPIDTFGLQSDKFLILDGGRINWRSYADELDALFVAPSNELFIHYQPWKPSSNAKKDIFRTRVGAVAREVADTLFAVVKPAPSMRTILDTRDACGGANSGLWLVVASKKSVDNEFLDKILHRGGFGSPLLVARALYDEAIAILCLDEGAWSTLLVRRDHPERQRLVRVYSFLHET